MYSEDAAEIILKLVRNGKSGKIYCIGSGTERMLKDYIHVVFYEVNGYDVSDEELGIGKIP